MPFDQQATGIRMNAYDALEKKYLENTSDVEKQIYLLWKKGKNLISYKLPIVKKIEIMAMKAVSNEKLYRQIMRGEVMVESKKFRFDELFDPTGRSHSAADKFLKDRGSSLLGIDTTPPSAIDDTHETDEYKQMSDELMKAYQMAWRNNMQLDGHTLEGIARIAQQLQNMSSVAESTEIDEIVEKAGIKKDGS
jgi:hypothetical protein